MDCSCNKNALADNKSVSKLGYISAEMGESGTCGVVSANFLGVCRV